MSAASATRAVSLGLQVALARIEAAEQELGRLDAAAGDGDHGSGMVRGLKAACATLPVDEAAQGAGTQSAGALLAQAGSAFSDAAGGASGALVGMFLIGTGEGLGEGPFDATTVARSLRSGLSMVQQMGQAEVGDKTMVDTLAPFIHDFANAAAGGATVTEAWRRALVAAEQGALSTADMIARRGRSARLGERSRGHLDPGAISMLYMLQAFGDALAEVCP